MTDKMNAVPRLHPKVDHRAGMDDKGYYIRTFTGKQLHWDYVEEHDFDIRDIAHALSTRVRWTGHVKRVNGLFITIGQHSCMVHDLVPKAHRKEGLMHDSTEAYMPDFPSPLKWWMIAHGDTAIHDLEKRVDAAIAKKLNVAFPRHPSVKEADLVMLATENRDFMPLAEERSFMTTPLADPIIPWSSEQTEKEFLQRWEAILRGEGS